MVDNFVEPKQSLNHQSIIDQENGVSNEMMTKEY